ncbi:CrcB protein [Frankineae bacterium MT45]|nr:CrcB protein [Frankineae bacterium MT45]
MIVALVFFGGAGGAVLRYLADRSVTGWRDRARPGDLFPYGTLLVNVIGCFILGVITAGALDAHWGGRVVALLGTGLCGGLTTFSTFAVESVQLERHRRPIVMLAYLALSLLLGIGAAQLGWLVG